MHWKNSNFGIMAFIAGSCHTSDESYRKLLELKEEREVAIKNVNASILREQAKIKKSEFIISNKDSTEWEVLEAKADLEEIEAFKEQTQSCYNEAIRERDYINSLIEQVKPFRKYAHLSDHDAHQATQQEEWKLELIFRAENFLASQGSIPHDHLSTMRMHPEFNSYILPRVQEVSALIHNRREAQLVLMNPNISEEQKQLASNFIEHTEEPISVKKLPIG